MVLFSHAKINLGLQVLDKRPDGYHNLETVFYPIPLNDILEIIPSEDGTFGNCEFIPSGLMVPGDHQHNLCVKAYRTLSEDFNLPSVKIYLHKIIPFGAGLGGGSSNATHVLKGLNIIFNLQLNDEELKKYAVKLGADCTFFLHDTPCFAQGIGEILKPIEINLSDYKLILITPNLPISTKEAFENLNSQRESFQIEEKITHSKVREWGAFLKNDFQEGLIQNRKEFNDLYEILEKENPDYFSLSGTGSTMYALFNKENNDLLNISKRLKHYSNNLNYAFFDLDLEA